MRIADMYRPVLLTCGPDDSIRSAARTMTAEQVGALAVVADSRVLGVITERDIIHAVATRPDLATVTAADCMSKYLQVANIDADSRDIARVMLDAGVRHLPVSTDDTLVGMVSIRDLLAVETWA